jgi:hypothetical protein
MLPSLENVTVPQRGAGDCLSRFGEFSAPPDLVRLSSEQLHRPELPEARCLARAAAMFQ